MNSADLNIRETDAGLTIRLHVQPRAKRTEVAGIHNGALKVKVTAPPVDDAANKAILEFLSDFLDLPKANLHIIAGDKSRDKMLRIKGLSLQNFRTRLELQDS